MKKLTDFGNRLKKMLTIVECCSFKITNGYLLNLSLVAQDRFQMLHSFFRDIKCCTNCTSNSSNGWVSFPFVALAMPFFGSVCFFSGPYFFQSKVRIDVHLWQVSHNVPKVFPFLRFNELRRCHCLEFHFFLKEYELSCPLFATF